MSPRLVPVDGLQEPESRFANDAMARLWQNAQDRETGAEAVEAIRTRRQQEDALAAAKQGGRVRRFLLGR